MSSHQTVQDELTRNDWVAHARCRNEDPDALFVRGAQQRKAIEICNECSVAEMCRVDAMNQNIQYGVWGGMTERQRRALIRHNPGVTDWSEFFANQSEDFVKKLPF